MKRFYLMSATVLVASFASATAFATPVYVGVALGNAVPTQVAEGDGVVSYGSAANPIQIDTSGLYVGVNAYGTPPQAEPGLLSETITLSGSMAGGGSVSVYVTELNQFPTNFSAFVSSFAATFVPLSTLGPNQTLNLASSVVESTYVTECVPANTQCDPSYAFSEGNLLSTTTFTQANATPYASPITEAANVPAGFTPYYATTEVYTVTFDAPSGVNTFGGVTASIDIDVPEPASMMLIGTGLAGLGALRLRRRA